MDRDKNRDDDSFSIGDLIEAVGCGGGMVGTIQQIQLAALTPWRAGPPRKKDEKSLNILKVFISLKKDEMVKMSKTLMAKNHCCRGNNITS